MNKNNLSVGLAVGLILAFSSQAFAEEAATKASLESRYISESDVDNQTGDLVISETKFLIEHKFNLENGMPITISFMDKHTDIDNNDVPVFLPEQLEGRSLGLGAKFPAPFTQSDNYFVGVDVYPSMYTDGWDESSWSAFRMPFRTLLIYKRDENFIVFGGLSIRPNFDTAVLPLFGFIYKPNDRLAFHFDSDNPNISYKLTDKTKVLWEADIINDEYEVTRNGELGRVLLYRELSTGVGLKHKFTDIFSGLVSAGGVFSRSIRYEDDQGKVEPEAGMYVKARLTAKF